MYCVNIWLTFHGTDFINLTELCCLSTTAAAVCLSVCPAYVALLPRKNCFPFGTQQGTATRSHATRPHERRGQHLGPPLGPGPWASAAPSHCMPSQTPLPSRAPLHLSCCTCLAFMSACHHPAIILPSSCHHPASRPPSCSTTQPLYCCSSHVCLCCLLPA